MRKALVIAILALFGSETLAQHGFRPTNRPGNPPPFHSTSGRPVLLDSEDNEMFRVERPIGGPQGPLINRPILTNTFDEVEDNEMALDLRLPREPTYRIKFAEEDDELFTQADMARMSGPFLPKSGVVGGGGSVPGGVAMGGTGQLNLNVGRNTQLIGGLSASHAPGSRVNFAPHVGVNFKFDDAQDDELFAEDDELFTQGDLGRMSSPFLSGSGVVGGGGSVRGGVAMGGTGQLNLNVGRNTQLIGGLSASHAPGSRVNFAPHVGVNFKFDDAQDDELFAEDDELFTQADMARMSGPFLPKSGVVGGGGSVPGGVAMGGTGQLNLNVGRNTQLIGGLSASHAPGSRVNFAPHVGVNFKFDDAQDDELFAEDDELFTQGDLGRMSSPFLPKSGAIGGGGSVPGGVAWSGTGQLNLNVARNTQLIGGLSASHAPGSRVNFAPHVGVNFKFDDAEN